MSAFPVRLPNPNDGISDDNKIIKLEDLHSPIPTMRVATFPGLFPLSVGGPFHPVEGICFLTMEDRLRLQALFAVRQFIAARCNEYPVFRGYVSESLFGCDDEKGVFTHALASSLYAELSLLADTFGMVEAGNDFICVRSERYLSSCAVLWDLDIDMRGYAQWLMGNSDAFRMIDAIERAKETLQAAGALAKQYDSAKSNFDDKKKRKAV